MNKHQIYKALGNMDRFGGNFIQSLAFCYSQADPSNQEKLFESFEPYFHQYLNWNND